MAASERLRRGRTVARVSRDIFVQDIPAAAASVEDIPDDWKPNPLPFLAERVVAEVRTLHPSVDASDPHLLDVALAGGSVEVAIPDERPLMSFALHIRTADPSAADDFVGDLLEQLGVRAFDPEGAPRSGIFGHG